MQVEGEQVDEEDELQVEKEEGVTNYKSVSITTGFRCSVSQNLQLFNTKLNLRKLSLF